MQIAIKNLDIKHITFIYLTAILFCANSGFYIKHIPLICPIYIFFYMAIFCTLLIIFKIRKFTLSFSSVFACITALYILISQYIVGGKLIAYMASFCTIMCYPIAIIILSKLSTPKVITVSKIMLVYNAILYSLDALYRLILLKFSPMAIVNNYINATKIKLSLYFCDSNGIGINAMCLFFLSIYLYEKTKEKIYFNLSIIYTIILFFTFSRIAVIALFFGFLIYKLYNLLRKNSTTVTKAPYILPVFTIIAFVIISASLTALIYLGIVINNYMQTDSSFLTKLKLLEDVNNFLCFADTKHLWLGMGFQTETNVGSFLTMYAHAYLPTYVVESGLCGFTLVTSFLLIIAKDTPKNLMFLIPFAIISISYIGHTFLNLFYITLAIVFILERRINQSSKI